MAEGPAAARAASPTPTKAAAPYVAPLDALYLRPCAPAQLVVAVRAALAAAGVDADFAEGECSSALTARCWAREPGHASHFTVRAVHPPAARTPVLELCSLKGDAAAFTRARRRFRCELGKGGLLAEGGEGGGGGGVGSGTSAASPASQLASAIATGLGKISNEFANPDSDFRAKILPSISNEFANPGSDLRAKILPSIGAALTKSVLSLLARPSGAAAAAAPPQEAAPAAAAPAPLPTAALFDTMAEALGEAHSDAEAEAAAHAFAQLALEPDALAALGALARDAIAHAGAASFTGDGRALVLLLEALLRRACASTGAGVGVDGRCAAAFALSTGACEQGLAAALCGLGAPERLLRAAAAEAPGVAASAALRREAAAAARMCVAVWRAGAFPVTPPSEGARTLAQLLEGDEELGEEARAMLRELPE